VRAVVPTVDLMPTLLELCGTTAADPIEGRSLLPLARGEPQPEREAMSELHWHEAEEFDCVRVASWKYIEHHTPQWTSGALFDLRADASECVEAQLMFADVTRDLRDALARRRNLAIELRVDHRPSPASELAPDEKARLKTLGYVGKDD
jgi:arylsulfatase A-like enzyme